MINKQITYIIVSLFLLLDHAVGVQIPIATVHSASLRVPEDYGNKYKRLVELEQMVEQLGVTTVEVPKPYGIASADVINLLKQIKPEIFIVWDQLNQNYRTFLQTSAHGVNFLSLKSTKEILSHIQQQIQQTFQAITEEQLMTEFKISPEFLIMLQELQAHGEYLMVRSTGDEDSTVLANAGGNLSVSYVAPQLPDLLKAAGQVIGSYFSLPSLRNRIEAGINPFEQPLKLSVLIQKLIGEPVGGEKDPQKIPTALVLFTNEPLYVNGENFRVMRISSTWGHGEGVVGNLGIANDSILLLASKAHPSEIFVLYDNRKKPIRLAPALDPASGKVKLAVVANSPKMSLERSLSPDLLKQLFILGVRTEQYFNDQATDMELVIKDNIIYPVQARPINRPLALPTYLDVTALQSLDVKPMIQTAEGKVIVTGRASALVLAPDEILSVEKLADAEKEGVFQRDKHKVIIANQDEPANSHPVVNFSGMGVPVLYIPSEKAQEVLARADPTRHLLVIDTQAGILTLWEKSLGDPTVWIKEGYLVHPAPVNISLDLAHPQPLDLGYSAPQLTDDLKRLLALIQQPGNRLIALHALDELQHHPFLTRLETWPSQLANSLQTLRFESHQGVATLETIQVFRNKLRSTIDELQQVLADPDSERLEVLFYAKVLAHLLNSKPEKNALAQYSLLNLDTAILDTEDALEYQKAFSFPPLLTDLVMEKRNAFTEEAANRWVAFLKTLDSMAQQPGEEQASLLQEIGRFQLVVKTLKVTGALPLWMAFFFHPTTNMTNQEQHELLHQILQPFDPETEALLNSLQQANDQIDQLEQRLTDFGDSEKFPDAWRALEEFSKHYTQTTDPQDPVIQIARGSILARVVAGQALSHLVHLFDSAIKTMKVNTDWTAEKRAAQFKTMLQPFFALLESWSTFINREQDFAMNQAWPLQFYLGQIHSILQALPTTDIQLQPSPNFSVKAAALGSGTQFDRHYPQTLEDIFTLIHQDLLVSLAGMSYGLRLDNEGNLPELVHMMVQAVQRFRTAKLIGISATANGLVLYFNQPLLNHSATFQFVYDKLTRQSRIDLQILGQNRARWIFIGNMAQLLQQIVPVAVGPSQVDDNMIALSWHIRDETEIDQTLAIIDVLAEFSLGHFSYLGNALVRLNLDENTIANFAFHLLGTTGQGYSTVGEETLKTQLARGVDTPILTLAKTQLSSPRVEDQVSALILWDMLFDHQMRYIEGMTSAALGMQNSATKAASLQLFELLVKHGQAFPQALAFAKVGFQDRNVDVQLKSISLMSALVGAGYGLSEGLELAKMGTANGTEPVRRTTVDLWKQLFLHGKGYEQALDRIRKLLSVPTTPVEDSHLMLLELLGARGEAYPEIVLAIQRASGADQENIQSRTLKLFKYLVRNNQNISEAVNAAVRGSRNSKTTVEIAATELFTELVSKGYSYLEALEAALLGMKDSADVQHLRSSLNLFKELVIKGQGYPEATASALLSMQNERLQRESMDLFEALINQNQGLLEAVEAVKIGISSLDFNLKNQSKELLLRLIVKGYGYQDAIEIAKKQSKPSDIWEALWSKEEGYSEAIEVAKTGLVDPNRQIQKNAVALFKALFEKNQGIQEAQEILDSIHQKSVEQTNLESTVRTLQVPRGLGTRIKVETIRTGDNLF